MKRILKWSAYFAAGVATLAAITLIVVKIYQKEILASINERLKETVNGDLNIGDYHITMLHNFPRITITLEDIYLRGPEYDRFQRAFLKARRIDINISPLKLLRKEVGIKTIDIEHGEVFVFRTVDGYSNTNVFKRRLAGARPSTGRLRVTDSKEINLQDVRLIYYDSLKKKSFGVHFVRTENTIASAGTNTSLHVEGNMTFEGLMLNAAKGTFLKNKNTLADLNIELDSTGRDVTLNTSKLIFDRSSIELSGSFLFNDPAGFTLDIQSDRMNYAEGLSILPDSLAKKLGKYFVEQPLKIKVNIQGVLESGVKPALDIAFSFQNSNASFGNLTFQQMDAIGTFHNHMNSDLPNDDSNSQLQFTHLKAVTNNLNVEAKATLSDLRDPKVDLAATFNADLKRLNDNVDSTKIRLTGGHFVSTFTYSGKLREYLDENRSQYEGKLAGKASISDGSVLFQERKATVKGLQADFRFTEKQFDIKKMNLTLNKDAIAVRGTVTDFIPFFVNPRKTGKVRLKISSPRLDMTSLLLARKGRSSRSKKAASKKRIATMVDRISNELEFRLDFDVKEFINKTFKATMVRGQIMLANDQFFIKDAGMNFADGKVALNLRVTDLERDVNPIVIDARLDDVGLKQFFYCFNDFNQTTFRNDHVDGKISLDLHLEAEVNDKLVLLMPNLRAQANFTIKDGRLKKFEPMQRLSNFLLKGRDFSDVQFGEITSSIDMRGTMLDISRMEIESTVLTMFIEGRYDLRDSTDLSIQVPLNNLKKRDQDIAPENIGVDAKAGASVFLRVRPDKNGKTSISFDPFKKLRKKKRR